MSGPYYDMYVLAPGVTLPADFETPRYVACVNAGRIEHTMIMVSDDGAVVLGLSVSDWDTPRREIAAIFTRFAACFGARWGYVGAEEPPVLGDFTGECRRRTLAFVDGVFIFER